MNFFRNIWDGLENFYLWFYIIWCDRNWDHHYIFIVLRHKLRLTEKLLREHGHGVDSEKDADNIKKCVLALDRLIEDEYWKLPREKRDYMQQQDLELLFGTMRKHILGWWD